MADRIAYLLPSPAVLRKGRGQAGWRGGTGGVLVVSAPSTGVDKRAASCAVVRWPG